ncbi:MAG: ATP-binding protein [Rhodoferax sp.]|uniref:ATP-binding protein n=1 Tax=Rhodoferax sp. TaxID=50421 RepID=UPI0026340650|nr:ATP-binding protein [Rhodoferax sp.]MDD2878815.1 ATP-binding protein [Rhodoferax sp.]
MSKASAFPAKRFFVEMLTRDIDLGDAILDLLDNSVDGAIRTGKVTDEQPYSGFHAHINLSSTEFQIADNCGGMTRATAEKYAFRFGRMEKDRDSDLATVGVYGIGMKRAIFKLGTNCIIASHHKTGQFSVTIDSAWMEDDDRWELDLVDDSSRQQVIGTTIKLDKLHQPVAIAFSEQKGGFIDDFYEVVQKHYSYIIEKGFEIKINGKIVHATTIQTLLDTAAFDSNSKGIQPYIYEVESGGVSVKLMMGLYERFPTDQEQDDSEKGLRNKESAGWTIICNDRVVVAADKTRMTGWGEAGVPAYHSQFTALAGVVIFRSNDALKLPVTTTKRGVDQNSELFGQIKEIMREALKHFTNFTNKWKGQTPERDAIQSQAASVDIRKAALSIPPEKWKDVRKGIGGKRFVPILPDPPSESRSRRIQFSRPIEEVSFLGDCLLGDAKAKAGDVGVASFEWALRKAKAI